jgi:hypothetical protein
MQRKSIIALAVIIIVLALLGYAASTFITTNNISTEAELDTFTVEKPNLVLIGNGLSRVEVWAVPTGTGITDTDHQKLGEATRTNIGTTTDERWVFQIPQNPMLVTEIYAKGFNANGDAVGKLSLDATGATSLHELLWGMEAAVESTVKIGETMTAGELTLKAIRVTEDSRCPADVQCIQAGRVRLEAQASSPQGTNTIVLGSDASLTYGKYIISLVGVAPMTKSSQQIKASDYIFTISVAEDVKG